MALYCAARSKVSKIFRNVFTVEIALFGQVKILETFCPVAKSEGLNGVEWFGAKQLKSLWIKIRSVF
jgi:hypothetical protein